MRYLFDLILFFCVAAVVGLGLTGLAVSRGVMFGGVTSGPWTAYPATGTPQPDPYARASIARRGRAPLALGDGLEFRSETDDDGERLTRNCDYLIEGGEPAARFWTISLHTRDGADPVNLAGRTGFSSRELLRDERGGFRILIAGEARPGNWLPAPTVDFLAVLRLYDTPLSTGGVRTATLEFPTIRRIDCR